MKDHYTYRVTWSAEDGEHVGLCTEFPSLSWLAATPEAALKGIRKVVAQTMGDLQQSGKRCRCHFPIVATAAGSWLESRPRYTVSSRPEPQRKASASTGWLAQN